MLGRGEDRGAKWLWVLSPKRKYLVVRGRNPASYIVAFGDTEQVNHIPDMLDRG